MPTRLGASEAVLDAIFAQTNRLDWESRHLILRFLSGDYVRPSRQETARTRNAPENPTNFAATVSAQNNASQNNVSSQNIISNNNNNQNERSQHTRQILLHEERRTELRPASSQPHRLKSYTIIDQIIFEMDYENGVWRKLRRRIRVLNRKRDVALSLENLDANGDPLPGFEHHYGGDDVDNLDHGSDAMAQTRLGRSFDNVTTPEVNSRNWSQASLNLSRGRSSVSSPDPSENVTANNYQPFPLMSERQAAATISREPAAALSVPLSHTNENNNHDATMPMDVDEPVNNLPAPDSNSQQPATQQRNSSSYQPLDRTFSSATNVSTSSELMNSNLAQLFPRTFSVDTAPRANETNPNSRQRSSNSIQRVLSLQRPSLAMNRSQSSSTNVPNNNDSSSPSLVNQRRTSWAHTLSDEPNMHRRRSEAPATSLLAHAANPPITNGPRRLFGRRGSENNNDGCQACLKPFSRCECVVEKTMILCGR